MPKEPVEFCDFDYCHKWLCAPKGSAFLYARPSQQHLIEPLVVGWGWGEDREISFGSDFLDYLQWMGTNDLSAYLSVPAAISFFEQHDWAEVRGRCHELINQAIQGIEELTRLPPLYWDDSRYYQIAILMLPKVEDIRRAKADFYNRFGVEIPFIESNDHQLLRVCVQGYNASSDIDKLLSSIAEFFDL